MEVAAQAGARRGQSTWGPASPGPGVLTAPCLRQSVAGAEGLSLAFRHIASSLLGHCSQVSCESLLHEVIVCVGYFTVNHPDNQVRGPEGPRGCSPAPAVRHGGEKRQAGLPEPSVLPETLHRATSLPGDLVGTGGAQGLLSEL